MPLFFQEAINNSGICQSRISCTSFRSISCFKEYLYTNENTKTIM